MIAIETVAGVAIAGGVGSLVLWQLVMSAREAFFATIVVDEDGLDADVRRRAERGHEPDWYRYDAELDRSVEPLDESLRSRAATCLTLGVLGTIVSVGALSLLSAGSGGEVSALLQHLALALIGNLLGIVANILISRIGIPRLERRAFVLSQEVRQRLRLTAGSFPPRIIDEGAYEALFARALKDALSALPSAVGRMSEIVKESDEAARRREDAVSALASRMGDAAGEIATAALALAPVAVVYARVAANLEEVPAQIAAALQDARTGWVDDVRTVHEALADETKRYVDSARVEDKAREERHRTTMHGIQSSLETVRLQLERLPGQFDTGSEQAGRNLAGAFRREAREQLDQVRELLRQDFEKIAETHKTAQGVQLAALRATQDQWQERIAGSTAAVVKLAGEALRETIVKDLLSVSTVLTANSATLADVGHRLSEAHERVATAQATAASGWSQVATKVQASCDHLASVNHDFSVAEAKLREVAESLSQFRDLADSLTHSLAEGARLGASEHLARLEPVHRGLIAVTERLADAQRRQSEVAQRLVDALAVELD